MEWRSGSGFAPGLLDVEQPIPHAHGYTYAPADAKERIPEVAVPVCMNLWSFKDCAAHNQEVVIRDFVYRQ